MLTVLMISIIAGFLGALTGLGGGSIMIPVLVGFGVPVKYAIAEHGHDYRHIKWVRGLIR